MVDSDWSITHTSHKGKPQIELRTNLGGDLLIIVAPKGWTYKKENPKAREIHYNTSGFDIRFSTNGVLNLDFEDWYNINSMVNDAIDRLTNTNGE